MLATLLALSLLGLPQDINGPGAGQSPPWTCVLSWPRAVCFDGSCIGTVRPGSTEPAVGVEIQVQSSNGLDLGATETDSEGRFTWELEPGQQALDSD